MGISTCVTARTEEVEADDDDAEEEDEVDREGTKVGEEEEEEESTGSRTALWCSACFAAASAMASPRVATAAPSHFVSIASAPRLA